jgi:hypothetical protein
LRGVNRRRLSRNWCPAERAGFLSLSLFSSGYLHSVLSPSLPSSHSIPLGQARAVTRLLDTCVCVCACAFARERAHVLVLELTYLCTLANVCPVRLLTFAFARAVDLFVCVCVCVCARAHVRDCVTICARVNMRGCITCGMRACTCVCPTGTTAGSGANLICMDAHTHTSFIEQTQFRQAICFAEMASSTPCWTQARTLACGLCRCYYFSSLLPHHYTRPRLLRYPVMHSISTLNYPSLGALSRNNLFSS